ncbi:MAG: hypothetical protein GY775_00310 [Candidatus Scalindua sp.]|nr:hypothetical protein [Candidatus Scalindua sp.]
MLPVRPVAMSLHQGFSHIHQCTLENSSGTALAFHNTLRYDNGNLKVSPPTGRQALRLNSMTLRPIDPFILIPQLMFVNLRN